MSGPRAVAAAACLAAAAVAAPAAAYVRTTDRNTGVEVSWPLPVVAYDLSSADAFACCATSPCDPGAGAAAIEGAVRASFGEWEQGCADLRLVYGGKLPEIRVGIGGSAENVVVIRKGWCSATPAASACMAEPDVDCGNFFDCFDDGPTGANRSTVALTTVLYDPATGRVYDADMEVNGWDGQGAGSSLGVGTGTGPPHGYYFTCEKQPAWPTCTAYGQLDCYGYDLQNTVTHEAGHFLGLAHPCGDPGTPACNTPLPAGETVPYADRTMYPVTEIGDTRKRVLSADDVAGVCAIYPVPSGCGCASGGEAGAVAALLAALALRPCLRRRARPRSRPPGGGRR